MLLCSFTGRNASICVLIKGVAVLHRFYCKPVGRSLVDMSLPMLK